MTRVYYKDSVGAFLMFDVNRPKTFESVMRWKLITDVDLDTKVCLSVDSSVPCLFFVNKCDLVQKTEADEKVLRDSAKQNGFIGHQRII